MFVDLDGAVRAVLASLRRPVTVAAVLARRRWLSMAAAIVAAAVVGGATMSSLRAVDAERARWGETAAAVRVRRDLAVGDVIGAGDVERVRWPTAVLPIGALVEPPVGALARRPVGEGEVLIDDDVTASGPLSLVPAGWRAVAVRPELLAGLPITPGDRLEVAVAGRVLAPGVLVAVADEGVLVAVPADAAPAVADAARVGDAAVVWVPPP